MLCGREIVFLLTPLDWMLPSLLGDAVAFLGYQVPLDSFFVLSFWRRLIPKLLLQRFLINRLPVLDAVELGWLFFASLGGSYLRSIVPVPLRCLFANRGESCCHHPVPAPI